MDLLGILTRTPDSASVTFKHHYRTTCDDLWTALTTPERLSRWFAPVTGDFTVGGDYHIDFEPGDDTQKVTGTITTCTAPHDLTVTWKAARDTQHTHVHCTLETAQSDTGQPGTLLTLTHSGLHHNQDSGMAAGWEVYVRHLAYEVTPADENDEGPGDWWAQWAIFQKAYAQTQS